MDRIYSAVEPWLPVIISFFAFKDAANFWDIINSPILVALVTGWLAWLVNKRFKEVADKADDVAAASQAEVEVAVAAEDLPREAAPAFAAPAAANGDHFNEAAPIIQRLKDCVDAKIDALTDGRRRRKYASTVGRRDYRVRVAALANDGGLAEHERADLLHAFHIWRPYQTHQRDTPRDILLQLQAIAERLEAE